jgi:hypothetical protein
MEQEIWLDIQGYEGCYQVSSLGRIYSVPRKGKPNGAIRKTRVRKSDGYVDVNLCTPETGTRKHTVHLLVARAFLGEAPEGFEVSHEDGDRANPRLSNLRYRTHEDNVALMETHGTKPIGEQTTYAVLNEEKVMRIKELLSKGGLRYIDIAERFGVSKGAIQMISNGRTWRHVNVDQ